MKTVQEQLREFLHTHESNKAEIHAAAVDLFTRLASQVRETTQSIRAQTNFGGDEPEVTIAYKDVAVTTQLLEHGLFVSSAGDGRPKESVRSVQYDPTTKAYAAIRPEGQSDIAGTYEVASLLDEMLSRWTKEHNGYIGSRKL